MPRLTLKSTRELARPLIEFLEQNYPAISAEARIGFAIQIALAERRGEQESVELQDVGNGRSEN